MHYQVYVINIEEISLFYSIYIYALYLTLFGLNGIDIYVIYPIQPFINILFSMNEYTYKLYSQINIYIFSLDNKSKIDIFGNFCVILVYIRI